MMTTTLDPNMTTRIDGAGLRGGRGVVDHWYEGGVDDGLTPARSALAEARALSWLGRRDPFYPDPEAAP